MSAPPITGKKYRCKQCGHETFEQTNHYGDIYSECRNCPPYKRPSTKECLEPVPEGGWVPPPWKMVKLGDVIK